MSPDGKRITATCRANEVQLWDILPDAAALVSQAEKDVSRCLTVAQRQSFFLPLEPPAWCIEMEKWPYNTPEWKAWLADKRAGKNPPGPAPPPVLRNYVREESQLDQDR